MGSKGSNSAPPVSSKRTGSSKRRRTCSGGLAKTSPPAGFESTSFAWAHAGPAMANDKQVRRISTTDRSLISTLPSEPAVADGFDHTSFIMLSGEVRLFTNLLELDFVHSVRKKGRVRSSPVRHREVMMRTLPTSLDATPAEPLRAPVLRTRMALRSGAARRSDPRSRQKNRWCRLTRHGPGANRAIPALPSGPQPRRLVGAGGEPCAAGVAGEDVRAQ